jgi:hypothetical protein
VAWAQWAHTGQSVPSVSVQGTNNPWLWFLPEEGSSAPQQSALEQVSRLDVWTMIVPSHGLSVTVSMTSVVGNPAERP